VNTIMVSFIILSKLPGDNLSLAGVMAWPDNLKTGTSSLVGVMIMHGTLASPPNMHCFMRVHEAHRHKNATSICLVDCPVSMLFWNHCAQPSSPHMQMVNNAHYCKQLLVDTVCNMPHLIPSFLIDCHLPGCISIINVID